MFFSKHPTEEQLRRRQGRKISGNEKLAAVRRLLRGEEPEAVARDLEVSKKRLARWESVFMNAGSAALAQSSSAGRYSRRKIDKQMIAVIALAVIGIILVVVELGRMAPTPRSTAPRRR